MQVLAIKYFLYLFLQVTERCGLFYNFTAVSGYKGGTGEGGGG
jgi:hypothetical protein